MVTTWNNGRQLIDKPDQGWPGGPAILVVLAVARCRHAEVQSEKLPVKVNQEVTQDRRRGDVCMLVILVPVVRSVVAVMVASFQIVLGEGVVRMVSFATPLMGVVDCRRHDPPYQHRS